MDEWEHQLLVKIQKYDPHPTHARVCIHIINSKQLEKEIKEKLQGEIRGLVSKLLIHQFDAPYIADVFLDKENHIKNVELKREPLKLCGRYFKASRTLSQTPMFVDGGSRRIGTNSVQELICNAIIQEFYQNEQDAKDAKVNFAGAGREDVDVRVYGTGRKFILTIPNPTKNALPIQDLLLELQDRIKTTSEATVRVLDFKIADEADEKNVLESAELRRKLYVSVVELSRPVDNIKLVDGLKELLIHQRTPIRVAHRRAMMIRDRTVHGTTVAEISPTVFLLWIDAGAGFYIKEFVHGDLGRTTPSISEMLGCDARLVALDFLGSSEEGFDNVDIAKFLY